MVEPGDKSRGAPNMQDLVEGLLSHYTTQRAPVMVSPNVVWRPATDVYETPDSIVVRIDVSGMRRDDFEIIVDGEDVVIRGQRRDPTPPGKKHFHKMEINVGPFERRIRIPGMFDPHEVSAVYENGFLELKMGKTEKLPPTRIRIEIE